MFERFTDRARKVMALANQEAQRFNHEYIGTEHILLGLVKEGSGAGAEVLKNLRVDLRTARLEVEKLVKSGPEMVSMGKLPQTPRAKRVIEYAIEEARNLGHHYVGTEHVLLGLLREQEGVAAQVLMNLGLKLNDVRDAVRRHLAADVLNPSREPPNTPVAGVPIDPEKAKFLESVFQHDEAATLLRQAMQELQQRVVQAGKNNDLELAAGYRDLVGAVSCTLHRLAWVLWREPPGKR